MFFFFSSNFFRYNGDSSASNLRPTWKGEVAAISDYFFANCYEYLTGVALPVVYPLGLYTDASYAPTENAVSFSTMGHALAQNEMQIIFWRSHTVTVKSALEPLYTSACERSARMQRLA